MRNTYKVLAEMYEQQVNDVNVLQMPDGTVVDTQKLQSLFAKIDRNMNDSGFYGDIDDAKVYDALRRGDVEGAADEICYSYTGQDGGEVDTEGIFKDVVSSLNYMIRNSKPTGMHPGVEDEGNEFTGDLAHTQKGDKFKISGNTVTNTTGQIAEKVCPICGMDLKGCKCAEKVSMAETTKPKVHMTGGDPKDPASAIKASKFSHHGG